jgi:hypothetical protein
MVGNIILTTLLLKKKQRLIDLGHFLTQNSKASQEALDLADKRIKELEV